MWSPKGHHFVLCRELEGLSITPEEEAMTKRERIALLSVLLALVLAVLWALWMTTGCTPTEPTDGGGATGSSTYPQSQGDDWPAVPLEQSSYYPMRLTQAVGPIALVVQAPPHACQPGIFGVCMTCLANKQRRAQQDTTGTYGWTYVSFNPMPMFGQRNRNQK